jgi:hypothetical protein
MTHAVVRACGRLDILVNNTAPFALLVKHRRFGKFPRAPRGTGVMQVKVMVDCSVQRRILERDRRNFRSWIALLVVCAPIPLAVLIWNS